jgi:hypothetical protein
MDIQLTKNADKLICVIYKIYLERIKNGQSMRNAKYFEHLKYGKSDIRENKHLSGWHPDDISDILAELKNLGFIKLFIGGSFSLESPGIIYMENRFKNGLIEVTDFLAKFL